MRARPHPAHVSGGERPRGPRRRVARRITSGGPPQNASRATACAFRHFVVCSRDRACRVRFFHLGKGNNVVAEKRVADSTSATAAVHRPRGKGGYVSRALVLASSRGLADSRERGKKNVLPAAAALALVVAAACLLLSSPHQHRIVSCRVLVPRTIFRACACVHACVRERASTIEP